MTVDRNHSANSGAISADDLEHRVKALLSRRELMARTGIGSFLLAYAALPAPARAALNRYGTAASADQITPARRRTLRSLWDAVVPGTWEGVIEDYLEDGVTPAPGSTDAKVQEWLELVADSLPDFLEWLTESFLALWAEDIDLWADITKWPWFDDEPDFADLPLDPCRNGVKQTGRQSKIILMQRLFHTFIDLKYQSGIILVRVAFFCDFYFEAKGRNRRVGRKYIDFPLPPGRRPYRRFTYNRRLGDHDSHLITVNPARRLLAPA